MSEQLRRLLSAIDEAKARREYGNVACPQCLDYGAYHRSIHLFATERVPCNCQS